MWDGQRALSQLVAEGTSSEPDRRAGCWGSIQSLIRGHLDATRWLIGGLKRERKRTLAGLLVLLQKNGKCIGCGPEVIQHVAVNGNEAFPVPLFDVHAGGEATWAGAHLLFTIPETSPRPWGHLIVRNLDAPVAPGLRASEQLEVTRQHELFHVFQSLSGEGAYILKAADLQLAHGLAELIPTCAARGTLSKADAFSMATRFYLYLFKRELQACDRVDYPFYQKMFAPNDRKIEYCRGSLMCMVVGWPFEPLAVGFIDTYSIGWRKWRRSVSPKVDELTQGTFLEEPVLYAGISVTPSSILRSVVVSDGLICNNRNARMPFA